MMRAAICEDNRADAEMLIRLICDIEGDTPAADWYHSAEDLLSAYVQGNRYDILFMDIQLPGINGFEAAKTIHNEYHEERPLVVFLTITDKYVFDAYNVGWDYVCKPIDRKRVRLLYSRAQEELSQRKILIQAKEGSFVLASKDIIYAESDSGTVNITTLQGEYKTKMTLENFEELLDRRSYYKVHRCVVVNLRHVMRFTQVEITLSGGSVVPLSRKRKKQFIECLEDFHRGIYYG